MRRRFQIAKADERIAQAKADAVSIQLAADVERAYFDLLIAQRRQSEARANVEIAERKLQIASAAAAPVDGVVERETALLEAKKAILAASDNVKELTAKANLEMVRAKVAAESLKTVTDLDRTRRILELTRQVASLQRDATPRDQAPGPEARAALAKAEAEMFQAELDYRIAYAELKRVAAGQ